MNIKLSGSLGNTYSQSKIEENLRQISGSSGTLLSKASLDEFFTAQIPSLKSSEENLKALLFDHYLRTQVLANVQTDYDTVSIDIKSLAKTMDTELTKAYKYASAALRLDTNGDGELTSAEAKLGRTASNRFMRFIAKSNNDQPVILFNPEQRSLDYKQPDLSRINKTERGLYLFNLSRQVEQEGKTLGLALDSLRKA